MKNSEISERGGIVIGMIEAIKSGEARELADMRDSLLRDRPSALLPTQGNEAFQQHKLLASAVHRASRLNGRKSDNETEAWVRYFDEHFPPARNDREDARTLFGDWRTSLLKDQYARTDRRDHARAVWSALAS